MGEQLFAPAFAAIRAANNGSVPEDKLQAAFAESWRVRSMPSPINTVHGSDSGRRLAVFRQTEVTEPMFATAIRIPKSTRAIGWE